MSILGILDLILTSFARHPRQVRHVETRCERERFVAGRLVGCWPPDLQLLVVAHRCDSAAVGAQRQRYDGEKAVEISYEQGAGPRTASSKVRHLDDAYGLRCVLAARHYEQVSVHLTHREARHVAVGGVGLEDVQQLRADGVVDDDVAIA